MTSPALFSDSTSRHQTSAYTLLLVFSTFFLGVSCQGSCTGTILGKTISFSQCVNLDGSGNFYLAWSANKNAGAGATAGTPVTVFFQGKPESPYGWAGWGVSPDGGMMGSDSIVGYGTGTDASVMKAGVYKLQTTKSSGVLLGQSYGLMVVDQTTLAVDYDTSANMFKTIANVTIPAGSGSVNVIWRGGPGLLSGGSNGELVGHTDYSAASRSIDFSLASSSGDASTSSGAAGVSELETTAKNSKQKSVHAFLSAIGFGVLLPLGVLVARHLKLWADPAWFYTHIALQVTGYAVGVAGWALGIWLKQQFDDISSWPSYQFDHYCIGITIFCTATLQVLTPVLKPDKAAPQRLSWNIVHWGLGYSTLILSFVQIFFGFAILRGEGMDYGGWQTAYIIFLSVWLFLFLVLEPVSWYKYRLQRVEEQDMENLRCKGTPSHGV